jgi:hypothetical protein
MNSYFGRLDHVFGHEAGSVRLLTILRHFSSEAFSALVIVFDFFIVFVFFGDQLLELVRDTSRSSLVSGLRWL